MVASMRALAIAVTTLATAAGTLASPAAIPSVELNGRAPDQGSDAPAADGASSACRRTKVAVLGAGMAGITAAKALSNASITDFLIVEYNNEIGGRVKHTNFGKKPGGGSYVIEEGANWVQGIHNNDTGAENPVWTLAKLAKLANKYSNYSSIKTYTQNGYDDFTDLLDQYEDAYETFQASAGQILTQNLQDRSARSGLALSGWNPRQDPKARTADFWEWDWEYGEPPEQSSQEFGVVNYNTSFYQWSDENNFSIDQRGFNTIIKYLASTYLKPNDTRLLYNTIVKRIAYSDKGVTVTNRDGSCIQADYAICTFSLGVLQNALGTGNLSFAPTLPAWKQTGIETFVMATYTKIFLQFPPNQVFWDKNTQYFLYADPTTRGYYPVWQSLDTPGFLPGSGIFFVTVVSPTSYTVEAQDDATTKAQVLAVLRSMFGKDKVPDPIAFYYPRWTQVPWAYGSYSNWPVGTTLEMHQNLRANVNRLWFAGEATSPEYYGFLQGAYYEGASAGSRIAGCINGNKTSCQSEPNYPVLHGTTELNEYNINNGWSTRAFPDFPESD